MNYKISHPNKIINCEINLPASKSISNRLLIIQALSNKTITIENISKSEDTINLKKGIFASNKNIDINHSGTAFRFLTSYLSSIKDKEYLLTGSKRIQERPIKELVDILVQMGANINYINKKGFAPLKIKGRTLKGGSYQISGKISSQFITSLLLIAPTLENGIKLQIDGSLVSAPYVYMTLKIMKEFGVESEWKDNTICIKKQCYLSKVTSVESDWSAASFWFQIAALSSNCNIILNGLNDRSIQGDKKCRYFFDRLGVSSKFLNKSLVLTKNKKVYSNLNYNLVKYPDLFQPLACTHFAKNIKAKFSGTDSLKIKESNRLQVVADELQKLNTNKSIDTYNDHRMAMSFAPLCLSYGELQINNIEVVKKSYPNFWIDLKKAGFKISPVID